jgi:signal transduction histidine kinase
MQEDLPAASSQPPNGVPAASTGALGARRTRGRVMHELRSPLTTIIGFSSTLARQVAAGSLPVTQVVERLARIRVAAERMNELLNELDAMDERAEDTLRQRTAARRPAPPAP